MQSRIGDERTAVANQQGADVLIKIGEWFEAEVTTGSVFLKVGSFQRFWNVQGLPSH
jgi:hypothetical protein